MFGVACKSVSYKKTRNFILQTSKLKKKLHELFILCFTGVILSKKWGQTWGVHRKEKKGVGHIGGLSIKFKPGLKPSALYESIQSP